MCVCVSTKNSRQFDAAGSASCESAASTATHLATGENLLVHFPFWPPKSDYTTHSHAPRHHPLPNALLGLFRWSCFLSTVISTLQNHKKKKGIGDH